MFQKVFEYAGPHKKGLYAATAVVLVSVLMGVLPFVLAYQVIAPLVMGTEIDASFIILRVALVLVCLILQAILYGWGLNLSHKAAYDTLLRLRTALQKRFEKLPLGVIQDKGTGTVKKLFVDDVDSLEVLLAHSMPEGIANLMVPIAVYVAMFFVDWKLALLSLVENVTFHMQDTVEAQRLVAEQKQKPFADCELWGPISYDLILSKEAARLKHYDCPWSGGGFDGIIAPDLSTANTLVKSWLIHAHAVTCGAVVGAKVPIALTSRSANEEETYLSLVFCAVLDAWRKQNRAAE